MRAWLHRRRCQSGRFKVPHNALPSRVTERINEMPWPFNLDNEGKSPEREFIIAEAKRAWSYESPFPDLDESTPPENYDQMFMNLRISYKDSALLAKEFNELYANAWLPSNDFSENNYCKDPKKNFSFPEYDAFILDSMIRKFKPNRVLELGSGESTKVISSAVSNLNLSTRIDCVDKYASNETKVALRNLNVNYYESDIVNLNENLILSLQENDILFIDSSHVLKNCGDVEMIYLRIFPIIPKGVIVHVHDIFLPSNYPKIWIFDWKSVLTEQHLLGFWLDNREDIQILSANYWNLINQIELPETVEYLSGGSFWFKI